MRGYMFRNRWLALLFVGLVLAGTTRIVGTGEGDGALAEATQDLAQQRKRVEALSSGTRPEAAEDEVVIEFTPDEDLIDDAVGDDPSPIDDFSAEAPLDPEVVTEVEVVILPR